MHQKYIIQVYNNRFMKWFDYLIFYNRDNAKRCYQNIKKHSYNVSFRLIEVICYEFN